MTLNVIEAKAHFDAPEREVRIRVGGMEGCLYLDLGDEAWRAVEVDSAGWRVIDRPPVRFRFAAGMQPLAMRIRGGSINALRSFLNVQSDSDFVLVIVWALAVLRNRGPYPVIVLSGEQGSAKSTFCFRTVHGRTARWLPPSVIRLICLQKPPPPPPASRRATPEIRQKTRFGSP